jgi:esterase/lipase
MYLKMNVLAVEYPGYGIYKGPKTTSKQIIEDSESVFKFLTNELEINQKDIVICGRSIGSGPACYLSEKFNPGCLVLISANTSIKNIVGD